MHAGQKPPVQDREAGEKTAGSGNGGSEAGPGEARLNSQVEREHAEQEHGVEGQDAENRNETSRLDRVKSCWQDQEKLLRPTARTRRVQEQLQDALGVPVCTLGLYCLRFAYRWNLPELFYFPEVATPLPGSLPLGSHREPKSPALYRRAPFLADPEKSEREKRLGRYVEGKTFVQNGENEKEFSGGEVSLVAASKASSEYFPAPTHQQTSTRKYDCLSCRRTLRSPERAHSGGERIVVDTDGREGGGGAEEEEDTARRDEKEGEKPDEKGDKEKRSEERGLPRSGGQGNEADEMPDRLTAVFKPEGRQGWEVDHLISLLRTTLLIEDTGLLLRHRTSGADTVLTSQQAPSHRATGPASSPTSRGCEASSVIPRVFEFPSQDACVDATVAQVALREHQRRGEWGPFPSAFSLHRSVLTAGFSTHSAPSGSPGPSCSRQSILRQTHPISAQPACAPASLSSLPASCTFPTSSTPGSSSRPSFPRFSPDVAARGACISEASASLSPSSLSASSSFCPRSFPSPTGFSVPSLRSVSSAYSSAIPAIVSPCSLSTSRPLGCLPTVSMHSWNGVNLFLKTPAWQRLYERIGSRLMTHLLTFTCMFVDSRQFSLGAAPSQTWPALALRSPACFSPLASHAASRRPSPGGSDARLGSERGDSETTKKGRTREESDEGEGNEDECDREIRRQTSDGSTDSGRRQTGEKRWGRLREEKNTRNGEKELGKKKRESRLVARDPNGQEATVEKEAKGRKRCRGRSRGERRKKKLQCKQAESCATDSRPPPHLSRTDGSSHPSVCLPCGALTSQSFISPSSPACAFPSSPQAASFPPATASCSTAGAASPRSDTPQGASRVRAAATNSESLEVEERKPRNASNLHKASAETGCANASPSQDLSSLRQGHQPSVKQNKEEHPRGEGAKANAAFKEKAGAKEGKVNPARSLYIQISGEPLTQARLCELRHIHCLASRAAARQRVRNRNAKQARQRGGDGSESEATGTVDREFGVPGAGRHEEEKKKGTLGPLGEAEEGEDRQGRDGDETQTHTREGQKETPGLEGGGNRGGHATGRESGEGNLETENRGHRVSANSREKATSRSPSPSSPRPDATVPGEVEREKEMDGCKSRRDRRRLMALLRRRRRLATREAKRRSHLHRRLRSSGTSPSLALFSHKRETSPLFLNTQSSRQPGVRPSNLRLPRQLICHHSSFNKEGGLPSYALMSTLALRSAQRAATGRSKGEAKPAETTADGGRGGEPNCVSPTRRKRRCEKLLKEATSQRDDKEDVKEKNRGGEDCGDGGIEARILTKFVLFSPLLFTPLTSAFGRCRGAAKVARAIGERTRETREVLGALRRRLRQMRTNGNGNAQQRIEGETENATGALSAQPQVAHGNEHRSDEEQKNRTRIRQREAKEAENEEKNEIEMEKKMLKHVRQRLTKSVAFKSALSRWLLKGFKELLARYSRCDFLRLLRRHCPAKRPRRGNSSLSCRGDCSLSSRGSGSSSPASLPNNVRFASSRGPRVSAHSIDASGSAPSPLFSPPPSAPSSPSSPLPSLPSHPASLSSSRCERLAVLRLETPPDRVIAFLLAALRRIVPPQLLGGQRNFRLFLKRAKQFALLNSRESVTLHMLLHSMKMRPYTALASRSARRQSRSRTVHAQNWEPSRKANVRRVGRMRNALQRVQKAGETLETETERERATATPSSRERRKGRERWKRSARTEKGNETNHQWRGVKARGVHDFKEGRKMEVKEKARGRLQEVFLSRIVFFLFTQLVIPLLRQHFYVTEAEPSAHRMRFFRKIAWLAVEQQAALSLHRSCFAHLDSRGEAEERRAVRGLAENAAVFSAPASPEGSVLKPGASLSKRHVRSRAAEKQRPAGGPKETQETAKKGTRSLEKAEKHGGLRRTRLSLGSSEGSEEGPGARDEDKEERRERDRAKRRRDEVSSREAEKGGKRRRHERREETEAVFERSERRENPEEVEGGRGVDGGVWAHTGRQSDKNEEDENDDWLAQEIEDYVNPEILARVQEVSSVPTVRFLPKARGCRPLVNLSQPHSGVLLAHLLSAALERMENKAKEDRERRQAARQRRLKVLRDAGAFCLLFGDTWAVAGGSGDAVGDLQAAARTGRRETEERRPEAGETGRQQGEEDGERAGKQLRKRVVQMVLRNVLRAANREMGKGSMESIGKGGIEDEKQLLARLPVIASSFLFDSLPSPLPPPFPSQSYAHFVRQRLGAFLASLSARQLHARHPPFVSSSSALRSRLSSSSSSSPFLHCFSSFHRLSSRSHVCDTTRRSANRAGTVRSFSLRGASFPALRRGLVSDRRAAAASQRPPGSSSVSSARRSSSPAVSALSSPSVSRPSTFAPRAPLSLNSLTSPIRSSLAALCRFHPSVLGCSVLSFSDVHRRLLAWWSFYLRSFKKVEQLVARLGPRARVRRVSFSQIFCVVGDLQACYEGLTHAELLRSVQRALARANVQKMHVLKLYKRVVSPPVRERARVRGGRAASRERRNRRQGRAAHMERAETRRPGRLREQSRASDEDGNEANVHTEDAPCKDAPWRGREESRGGRGREARGDREERETEARGSGGRGKGEARETGGGRVAETRRDSKQREGEREENELKKTRGAEGTEGGEGKEEERNVKRVTGAARFRQTETAHFVSIGRVDEVAVPARDGRQPLLATLLLPAGRDKRRQETAETSVSTGALSRARAGHHVRVESARLSSRATTAVRMDATSSSRSWSMSFSSSSKPPDSRSLPACIEWSSFDSSFSASLPSSSSFSCAAPFPEPNSRVSPPDAAAVFRRRLLRGSSSGGVVLVSDSNQRLMLDSRELLLSVRLLLRHHRIRFCQRRQPFHYSPAHPPGFPPVHGGGRHGAALEAAADPPGDKRTGGSDPLSQRAFGTQEEAAKRSGEPCSTRETDGEPEGARQRLSLGREDGKAGPNLGAKDWHQARGGQPAVGSEGRAWSTEGVRGGQKEECPGRERERREEAKGVYRQTIGIPQGSNISGLLCALFYADRDARPEVQALLRGEDTSHRAGSLQLFARPSAVETDAGEALHASVGSAKKSGDEDRETNRLGAVEDARRFGSEEKKSRRETEERDKRGGGDRKHAERRDVFFRHVGPLILEVARKTRVEAIRAHTTSCGLPVSSDSTPSCPFSTSSSSLSSPAACTSSSLSLCSPSHSPPSSSLSLSPSPSPPTASSSSSSPSSSSSQASFCRLRRSEREALHALERELSRLVWPPLLMRWVDDFLFLSPSRAAAEAFLSLLLEKNVWGKNVNRQKLKTDLFAGSWSSTAAAFQKRSGERNQAEADAPRTPSAAFSAASPGTQSERDAVREVAARCEGEAQECLTRLRSCRWKSETNWGPGQNLGRINEEIKSETEFSGAVGDQTKGLGRSDAGDMTVGRRKRTRPEEGSTPFAKKTEARKKIKRDTSSVERKVKTPSPSPTYSSLQIYPPLSSHSFASSSSFSSSLSSQPSSSSASSLSSSSSPCASASAPSGSGPCWAGVRFAFDVQRRGFCVLPLLRRDVTPDVESSGSLSEARERGRRANKETLGDTSVQSSIRDSLALQRGKRAFLGRGATANGAEFMAEMLEQRLLGHLAMRLGTTRVFVDLRLNSPEAACRNVYVVVKTAFLKLRCGLERIAKEFAGFLRPAYILDLCMRLIDAVLSYTRQPIPFQWRSSPTASFSKGVSPSSRSLSVSPSTSSSRSLSVSPTVFEARGEIRGLSSRTFQQLLRLVCFNAAASVFRGFQSSKKSRTVTQACGRKGARYSQSREGKPHSSIKGTTSRRRVEALCSHCAELSATTSAPCFSILSSLPPSVERLASSVSLCHLPSTPSASACPAPSPQKSPHSASSPLSSDSQSLPFSASDHPGRPLLSAAAAAHAAGVPAQTSHSQKAPFRGEETCKCAHAMPGRTLEEDAMENTVNDEDGVCLSSDSRLNATVLLSDRQDLSSRACKPQIAMDVHASAPAWRGSPVSNPVRGWEEARDDETGRKQEDGFSKVMGEEREACRENDEKENALSSASLVGAIQVPRVERRGRQAERDRGRETGATDEEGCDAQRRRDEAESEGGTGKGGQERRDGSESADEQDTGEAEVGKGGEERGTTAEVEQEEGMEPKQGKRRHLDEAHSSNKRQSHDGLLSHKGAAFTDEEGESFKRCCMRCGHVFEISKSSETSPGNARCVEGERGLQKNREKVKALPFPSRSLSTQGKTKGQKAAEQKKQSFSACFAFFASKAKLAEVAVELRRQGRAGREPLRQRMQPGITTKLVRGTKRRKTGKKRSEKMDENTDTQVDKMKKKSQEEETETTSKEKTEKNRVQETQTLQDKTGQEEETEEKNTDKPKEAPHNFEAEAGRQSHTWEPCETAAERISSDENPRGTGMEVAAVDLENRIYSDSSRPSQETTLGLMDQKKRHKSGKAVDAKAPQREAGKATDSGDALHVQRMREGLAVRFSGSSQDARRMRWRRQSAETFACTQKRGRTSEQKLQDVGGSERAAVTALRGQEKGQEEKGEGEDEGSRQENAEKEDDAKEDGEKEDGEKEDGNEPCSVETKPVPVLPEAVHETRRQSASSCTSFLTKRDGLSPGFSCEDGRSFSSRSATQKALLEEAVRAYLCAQQVEKEEGDRGRGWPPVMRVASRKSAKRRRSKSTAAKMTPRD